MTQLTDKVFAIPMPDGAESCEIRGGHRYRPYPLLSFYGKGEAVILPPGEFKIVVFNTKTATEEDARKVVEEDKRGFKHYWNDKGFVPRGFNSRYKTALESLHSLLRSKSLDPKNNYALIEKESSDES